MWKLEAKQRLLAITFLKFGNCTKTCQGRENSVFYTLNNIYFVLYPGEFIVFITARVRSTTGRLCFDTCLSVCSQGGGQVQPAGGGGVRSSWPGGGVRSSRGGQVQGGQVQLGGVRSSRGGSGPAGWGVRSSQGGPGPAGGEVRSSQPGGGSGSAKIGQYREYLLHGGRYASCVHAGGLSCTQNIFT